MYRAYFSLHRLPFINTPDEAFFFAHSKYAGVLQAIQYAVERGDALIKVTGEVGTGKTTLLRLLAERLRRKGFHLVFISSPRLSAEEMLAHIARELNIAVADRDTKFNLYEKLSRYLLATYSKGNRIVILIDEAHAIPLDTLEEIRLLGNIETSREKLVQIVLFGQPELDRLLASPDARQVRSRITHSFHLEPLTVEELYEYLNFRMQRAGYVGPPVFSEEVAGLIHRMTGGVPRLVNNVADKLLLSAYLRRSRVVEPEDFRSLEVDDALLRQLGRGRRNNVLIWASVVSLGVVSLVLYTLFFRPDIHEGWLMAWRDAGTGTSAEQAAGDVGEAGQKQVTPEQVRTSAVEPVEAEQQAHVALKTVADEGTSTADVLDQRAVEMREAFGAEAVRTEAVWRPEDTVRARQLAAVDLPDGYYIDMGYVARCGRLKIVGKEQAFPIVVLRYVSGRRYLCEKLLGPFDRLGQARQVLRLLGLKSGVILEARSIEKRVDQRHAEIVYEY